jgi:hypothetical protein
MLFYAHVSYGRCSFLVFVNDDHITLRTHVLFSSFLSFSPFLPFSQVSRNVLTIGVRRPTPTTSEPNYCVAYVKYDFASPAIPSVSSLVPVPTLSSGAPPLPHHGLQSMFHVDFPSTNPPSMPGHHTVPAATAATPPVYFNSQLSAFVPSFLPAGKRPMATIAATNVGGGLGHPAMMPPAFGAAIPAGQPSFGYGNFPSVSRLPYGMPPQGPGTPFGAAAMAQFGSMGGFDGYGGSSLQCSTHSDCHGRSYLRLNPLCSCLFWW